MNAEPDDFRDEPERPRRLPHPGLGGFPGPERAAEVLRYQVLRLERALSPDGRLRRLLVSILRSAVVAAACCLCAAPAIGLIACYNGFYSRPGAAGVGRAATLAFVESFLAIIVLNLILANVLNTLDALFINGAPSLG